LDIDKQAKPIPPAYATGTHPVDALRASTVSPFSLGITRF
jgi:hypothetical protein